MMRIMITIKFILNFLIFNATLQFNSIRFKMMRKLDIFLKRYFQDICISAVKEKDIEAKLKMVISEWNHEELTFSLFKVCSRC